MVDDKKDQNYAQGHPEGLGQQVDASDDNKEQQEMLPIDFHFHGYKGSASRRQYKIILYFYC
jgi:hypothetical protein